MKWVLLCCMVATSCHAAKVAECQVIDSRWTNPTGGNWANTGNWDSLDFPNNGGGDQFHAIIDLATGSGYSVDLNLSPSLTELTLDSEDATLNLSGFSIAATTTNLQSGTFDFGGGGITGGLVLGNGANIGGSGFVDSSQLVMNSSVLTVGDGAAQFGTLRFRNGGTFTGNSIVAGGSGSGIASIRFDTNDHVLDNINLQLGNVTGTRLGNLFAEDVELTLGPNSVVRGLGSLRGNSGTTGDSIVNQGLVSADVAGRALFVNLDSFVNEAGGVLRASNGGTLRLGQNSSTSWSNQGVIEIEDGSIVRFDGDYASSDIGTLLRTGSNQVEVAGVWDNSTDFVLDESTGDFHLSNGRIVGGTVSLQGAGFTGSGIFDGARLDATTFDSTIRVGDDASTAGTLRFRNGGTFDGDAVVSGGSGSNVSSMRFDTTDTTLDTSTTIRLGGTDNTRTGNLFADGIELTLGSRVIVEGQGSIRGNSGSIDDTVVNQGAINANVNGRTLSLNVDSFTNEGVVSASNGGRLEIRNFVNTDNGIIRLNGGEIETADALLDLGGGRLEGDGTIDGDFVSSGMIAAGFSTGQIDFLDDLILEAGSSVEIELAGLNDFDTLTVAGDLVLAGEVNLALVDDFQISADQTFLFLEVAGSTTGAFDGLADGDIVGTFGNFDLRIDYSVDGTSNVGLFATSNVPEPSSAFLLLLGFSAITTRRSRP